MGVRVTGVVSGGCSLTLGGYLNNDNEIARAL